MSNVRLPVGSVIKQIMQEKGLKPIDVASKLKISRQNVYLTYSRLDMTDGEIRRWAHVLGTTWDEINKRRDVSMLSGAESNAKSGDQNYLLEHLSRLEEQFKAMAEQLQGQLAMKDQQIMKLMDLLGKLDLSESTPCGKERQMYLTMAS